MTRSRRRTTTRPVVLLTFALVAWLVPQTALAGQGAVVNTSPPVVTGTARFGEVLGSDPGAWDPAEVTLARQWLRNGRPIADATSARYRPQLRDIGNDIAVRITATAEDGGSGAATSQPVRIRRGVLVAERRPRVDGVRRFGRTLTATTGRWDRTPERVRYQWRRDDRPIRGATGRRLPLGVAEFGRRISVVVTATRPGFEAATAASRRTGPVAHRVPVRHTVTYSVQTRGRIVTSVATFKRQAQQTYDDPRGWRGAGVAFRRVPSGGDFTLVLAEASTVPSFSSACSASWSCRVGRYLVINQTRWRTASPMWHQQNRSVRDYRHMVVNHETGHWLGLGHRFCTGRGDLAPVMQQQSKGLDGCRPNPWPTAGERRLPRWG